MSDHRVTFTVVPDHSLKNRPANVPATVDILNKGNAIYASLGDVGSHEFVLSDEAVGLPREPGTDLPQEPHTVTLSCSDARIPVEQLFGCFINDLFVTRVAGNIASEDVLGTLHYASLTIPTVQVFVVMGHSLCGTVTAAVDSVLTPGSFQVLQGKTGFQAILDEIMPSVEMAAATLADMYGPEVVHAPGYREALISVGVVANTGIVAMRVQEELQRTVFIGVYNHTTRLVGIPGAKSLLTGLHPTPGTEANLKNLVANAAKVTPLTVEQPHSLRERHHAGAV